MSPHLCCQVCVWPLWGGVGDDDGSPQAGAWAYRNVC